jgi:hypothetical protein
MVSSSDDFRENICGKRLTFVMDTNEITFMRVI